MFDSFEFTKSHIQDCSHLPCHQRSSAYKRSVCRRRRSSSHLNATQHTSNYTTYLSDIHKYNTRIGNESLLKYNTTQMQFDYDNNIDKEDEEEDDEEDDDDDEEQEANLVVKVRGFFWKSFLRGK